MKILLVAFAARGAMGQYLHLMGKGFLSNKEMTTYISAPETFEYSTFWGSKYIKLGKNYKTTLDKFITLLNPLALFSWLYRIYVVRPDIIHVISGEFYPWVPFLYIYSRIIGSKLVLSIHDSSAHTGSALDSLLLKLRPLNLFLSDKIHFLSKSELFNYYDKKNKAFLIEHGSFEELFISYKNKYENNEKIYDFIFLGRIEHYKGLDIFAKALEELQLDSQVKILIAGPGGMDEETKLKLLSNKNVTLINEYLSDEDFGKYLALSKVIVLPYRHVTQSSLPIIANYFNVKIIASDLGDFSSLVPKLKGDLFQSENVDELKEKLLTNISQKKRLPVETSAYLFQNQSVEYLNQYKKITNKV